MAPKAKQKTGKNAKGRAKAAPKPKRRVFWAGIDRTARQTPKLNYEEILLESIMGTEHNYKVAEYATLFNSVLSNLSEGMRDLRYRSGISIGRVLYGLYDRRRNYRWYEESVHDFVSFLERAGYQKVTYRVFPDQIEVMIHHKSGMQLGTNMHAFEAGMMSGFLTAAKTRKVHVNETLCSHNGSEFCRFVTSDRYEPSEIDPQMTERFFEYFGSHLRDIEKQGMDGMRMPEEYYLLASLMHRDYLGEVKRIMMDMGSQLSGKMQITRANIEDAVKLLGFGEAKITSLKPLRGSISYGRLRAREEFVKMSIPFLDGLLSKTVGKSSRVEVTAVVNANRYNVKLIEKKALSKR